MARVRQAAQDKPAYRIYDRKGMEVSYGKMIRRLAEADVVLFGELHGNPLVHWLERETARSLFRRRKENLVIGLEMFETDDQIIIDEYMAGLITHPHFAAEAKLWPSYENDYRPLLDFARQKSIRLVATNCPRRYAHMVAHRGMAVLEALPEEAKRWLAPLPVHVDPSTPGYGDLAALGLATPMAKLSLMEAQALKDATMAYSILLHRRPGSLFLHFNGDFHSRGFGGIFRYLRKASPELGIMVISSVAGDPLDFGAGYRGLADFVLIVAAGLTPDTSDKE